MISANHQNTNGRETVCVLLLHTLYTLGQTVNLMKVSKSITLTLFYSLHKYYNYYYYFNTMITAFRKVKHGFFFGFPEKAEHQNWTLDLHFMPL